MSDRLTQEELEYLLSGIDEAATEDVVAEEFGSEAPARDNQIRNYDFTRREKRVFGRMPFLDRVNERFSRQFKSSLANFLGFSPDIDVPDVQMQPFSEYAQGLPLQTSMALAKVSQLRGRVLIVMEPRLVFALVDNYFGGGQLKNQGDNGLASPITMRIVRLVNEMIFKGLKQAWQPVMELDFDYADTEANPRFDALADPSEIVVISTLHIRLNGGGGDLHITLPYAMVEPLKDLLADNGLDGAQADGEWEAALRRQILQADVNVSTLLAGKIMTLRELMRIKEGDILPIEMPEAAVLSVQGIPVYEGKAGVSGEHYALRIIDKIG